MVLQDGDHIHFLAAFGQLTRRQVMVYVADVHAPDLVPSRGLEGHLFLLFFGSSFGLFQTVELAVCGKYSPACARAEIVSKLRQRHRDPELPEFGVLLELPHLVHSAQVHFSCSTARLVFQTVYAFGNPLLQSPVNRGAVSLQVAGDALYVPALEVQRHDDKPTLGSALYLVVGLEAPEHPYGRGVSFDDSPHRPAIRSFTETDVTDRGYLVVPHRRVLALEAEDESADLLV